MFITSDYYHAAEITYRHERIAADWAAANAGRRWRPARRRPHTALLRRPAHRTRRVIPA
jgi:hypothetical protein